MWLWLWPRPVAAAPIRSLAWKLPYATGAALKSKKKSNSHFVSYDSVAQVFEWCSMSMASPPHMVSSEEAQVSFPLFNNACWLGITLTYHLLSH